jgi:hypothetical protein
MTVDDLPAAAAKPSVNLRGGGRQFRQNHGLLYGKFNDIPKLAERWRDLRQKI